MTRLLRSTLAALAPIAVATSIACGASNATSPSGSIPNDPQCDWATIYDTLPPGATSPTNSAPPASPAAPSASSAASATP